MSTVSRRATSKPGPGRTARLAWLLLLLAPGLFAAGCPLSLDEDVDSLPPWPQWVEPDWLQLYLDCLPPLRHARGGRYPMILWRDVGHRALSPRQARELLRRGIAQHVPLRRDAIPSALMLQHAGAPVVVMEAHGAAWPYSLLEENDWRLPVDDPQRLPPLARPQADPTRLDAFVRGADEVRDTLRAFRDAGVTVDAVWLDFEGMPLLLDYDTLLAQPSLAAKLPPEAMRDRAGFARYRRQLWLSLMSAYLAAPIREVYPEASSTNWVVALSSPQVPVLSWDNWHHPSVLTLFSATNPVAYGIDTAYRALDGDRQGADSDAVDRLYMHVLLRQVSADAWNRSQLAPRQQSVPWVARRVQDQQGETPWMSRQRYREALRHLWLRDVDAMQVFNPSNHPDSVLRALAEAQDAQHVYAEMLAFRDLLQNGEVMNYQVPLPDAEGLLWSGLRNERNAVVRLVRLGGPHRRLRLQVWPDESVLLTASDEGMTYLLRRRPSGIQVQQVGQGDTTQTATPGTQ